MRGMDAPSLPAARPAHLGWRLLALVYDALPNIAIWFAVSAVGLLLRPGHAAFAAWSAGQWALWGVCWAISGLYAVHAWRRGGTLGMRPWRLRVIADDGGPATTARLWLRYAVGTLSLLAAGLGFVPALFDARRRALHDVVAGTMLVRIGDSA